MPMRQPRACLSVFIALVAVHASCTTPAPVVQKAKLEKLYRAGKTLASATEVGVNYQRFTELVQGLATEVSIASDAATTDGERRLLGLFREAADAYKDSLTIWTKKLAGDGVPHQSEKWLWVQYWEPAFGVLAKHHAPVLVKGSSEEMEPASEDGDSPTRFYPDDVRSLLWRIAGDKLAAAEKSYNAASH